MNRVAPSSSIDRRSFLRRAALVASGVVAADQLELLDRLGWVRKLFPAWGARPVGTFANVGPMWDALLQEDYVTAAIVEAYNTVTPFKWQFGPIGPKRLLARDGVTALTREYFDVVPR